MKTVLLFVVFSFNLIYPQIDTTKWYPLEVGNKWLYESGLEKLYYNSVEVIGDTLMPNGKVYAVLEGVGLKYQRNHNNQFVYYYNCFDSTESLLYDFISGDESFWKRPHEKLFWGIQSTGNEYDYYLNKNSEYKLFDWVSVDTVNGSVDTAWNAMIDVYPIKIVKGIGVESYYYAGFPGAGGMVGCIINGDTLGVLTSVHSDDKIIKSYHLEQNYPNPFNPTTTISYKLSGRNWVRLKVFDLLGRVVVQLVDGMQSEGSHKIEFNASNLSSGIYLFRLQSGDFVETKKMILLK